MGAAVRMLCATTAIMLASTVQQHVAFADGKLSRPSNPEARQKLTAGTRLYRLREFEKAIEEYKAGALKEDSAVFYYNLGQCYRQLGRYEDAIWHYQRFLDRADPLPPRYKTAVEGFIHDMRVELEHQAMTRPPTEVEEANAAAEAKPQRDVTADASEPRLTKVVEAGDPWYMDGLGWGLAGTGAAASGVAVYLLLDAKGLVDDANREPSQVTRDQLRERASKRQLAAGIVGIVGIGALVTGAVKLAIRPKERERTVTTGLHVGVSRNEIIVMGRF